MLRNINTAAGSRLRARVGGPSLYHGRRRRAARPKPSVHELVTSTAARMLTHVLSSLSSRPVASLRPVPSSSIAPSASHVPSSLVAARSRLKNLTIQLRHSVRSASRSACRPRPPVVSRSSYLRVHALK